MAIGWDDVQQGYEAGEALYEAATSSDTDKPETFIEKLTWGGEVPATQWPEEAPAATPPPGPQPPDGWWNGSRWVLDAHPDWVWVTEGGGAWWSGSQWFKPWSYPGSGVPTSAPATKATKARGYRAGLQDLLDKARVALLTGQRDLAGSYVTHGLDLVSAYAKSAALGSDELARWLADFKALIPATQGAAPPPPQSAVGQPGGVGGAVAAATAPAAGGGGAAVGLGIAALVAAALGIAALA